MLKSGEIMTKILHFSDTHGESKSIDLLNTLILKNPGVDVLAHTGDVVNSSSNTAPDLWNEFPQKIKLSVPGNHENSREAYANLTNWIHQTPWQYFVDDLFFASLNRPHDSNRVMELYDSYIKPNKSIIAGIVFLTHEWLLRYPYHVLSEEEKKHLGELYLYVSQKHPVLVLHGHDHNEGKEEGFTDGAVWEPKAQLGEFTYCRSNICSSSSLHRGLTHLIRWENRRFTCQELWKTVKYKKPEIS